MVWESQPDPRTHNQVLASGISHSHPIVDPTTPFRHRNFWFCIGTVLWSCSDVSRLRGSWRITDRRRGRLIRIFWRRRLVDWRVEGAPRRRCDRRRCSLRGWWFFNRKWRLFSGSLIAVEFPTHDRITSLITGVILVICLTIPIPSCTGISQSVAYL